MTNQSKTYTGIVAETKAPGSRMLKVYCQELLPCLEGSLKAVDIPVSVSMKDRQTQQYEGQPTLVNYLECEYRDMNTNRQDPPDVVTGEQVEVYQLADSQTYYWFSSGRDDNLRKTEHTRMMVSSSDTTGGERNDNNSYFIELDSRNGSRGITIRTAQGNGEKYKYVIQINTDAGTIQIADNENNEFYLNSEEKQLHMRNNDGSVVAIDKKNVSVVAIEDLILKAGRQVIYDSPLVTGTTNEGKGVTSFNAEAMSINVKGTFSINADAIGLNGAVVVPQTLVTGHHQATSYSTGDIK